MHSLFEKLDAKTVLITDLPRQAQQFNLAFSKWKHSQGIQAWATPKIFSWKEWIKSLGETLFWSEHYRPEDVPTLMSPTQEQIVWEQVISTQTNQALMHIPSTATIARQAWYLMQAWRLPDPRNEKFPTEDVKSFAVWAAHYLKICKTTALIDLVGMSDTIAEEIRMGTLPLPENIVLAGFVTFTPQQLDFIDTLKSQGSILSTYQPEKFNEKVEALSFESLEDENLAIAKWAKEILEHETEAKIGIVSSNLNKTQDELSYALRKILYPESFLSKEDFTNTAYQFSSGRPLIQAELANLALNLIELLNGKFSIEKIGQILRNPYCVGGKDEFSERLKLDLWLQQEAFQDLDLNSLLECLKIYKEKNSTTSKTTHFERSLQAITASSALIHSSFAPSVWAKHFSSHLEKFAWPAKELSYIEQREVQALRSCLTELASLDCVQAEVNISSAITSLRRICNKKHINHSLVNAPIQILDITEAYGLNFDYLWVTGLDKSELPKIPQINPLLPFREQKNHLLNLSTPELCLQDAKIRLAHLSNAAPTKVFSYTVLESSENEKALSILGPLKFKHIPTQENILFENQTEWVTENYGSKIETTEQVGTSVFKFQAECPFKAYAKTRLLPKNFIRSDYGLTALERGNLLHRVLEKIWLRLGDSENLKTAIHSDKLEEQILEVIDKVIFSYEKSLGQSISVHLKTLEQKRLLRLVFSWLNFESERSVFSIHKVEEAVELEINGLTVKGYIDRIDKIHNIGFAIIDYKSGSKTSAAWFGERPDELQMPIYALAMQNKVAAIVYANLKANDMGFNGISIENDIFSEIKAYDHLSEARRRGLTWTELMPYWKETLNQLAEDYKRGLAIPDPKNKAQTCQYCKLETLCRVNANKSLNADVDEFAYE